MKNAVVVGHGMVGHRFVEALRARDEAAEWKVTVLCEEALAAYDRVGLSSYVGAWDHKELALAGNDYPGDALVEMRTGVRAERIDRDHRTVVTSAGDTVDYDALVLATGSYPFVPPIAGQTCPRASSTAPSTIWTAFVPAPTPRAPEPSVWWSAVASSVSKRRMR